MLYLYTVINFITTIIFPKQQQSLFRLKLIITLRIYIKRVIIIAITISIFVGAHLYKLGLPFGLPRKHLLR